MGHFRIGRVFISVLWLAVFSFLLGCQTIETREAAQGGDKGLEASAQSGFSEENLCSLLTKQEVGALLKKKMADPELSGDDCTYRVAQPSSLTEFRIQMSTDDGSGFNFNRQSGKDEGRKIKEVKGLGDAAYFDDSYLHVLKGNVWLIFMTTGTGQLPSEKVMKALAKKAADRLP
ncbi:MAG: hypothetical protein M0Z60_14005 [Nitrospiraceae bacterium]|nr:hypothetical protein [Nitrospiraceae bacterium]